MITEHLESKFRRWSPKEYLLFDRNPRKGKVVLSNDYQLSLLKSYKRSQDDSEDDDRDNGAVFCVRFSSVRPAYHPLVISKSYLRHPSESTIPSQFARLPFFGGCIR